MDDKNHMSNAHDQVLLNGKEHNDASLADEGLQTLRVVEEEHLHLDAATSKRLRRRADMVIMPVKKSLNNKGLILVT